MTYYHCYFIYLFTHLLLPPIFTHLVEVCYCLLLMMMESPVGTTYELRPSSVDVSSCGR